MEIKVSKPVIPCETVEKPEKGNLQTSKYLILLYVNFTKIYKSDFFDSLSRYMQCGKTTFEPKKGRAR